MIAALTAMGLHFKRVEVVTEGTYLPEDVDWNYKDVPHLNHVHGWATNANGLTDDDAEASINLQKIFGLRLPLVLSHYETGPYRHSYFFTMLMYAIVCETTIERTDDGRTLVVTNYGVGSGRFWMLFFPLISFVLRRNYRQLMTEDVPMRERREQLRSWGCSYATDGRPLTMSESLVIERDNVIVPDVVAATDERVDLRALPAGTTLVGRSDHLGLRLERDGDQVEVFPRLCPHEGASLDEGVRDAGCVRCPWHGRKISSFGTLDVGEDGATLAAGPLQLDVEGTALRIRAGVRTSSDAPG
jgi:hypothetical protein